MERIEEQWGQWKEAQKQCNWEEAFISDTIFVFIFLFVISGNET